MGDAHAEGIQGGGCCHDAPGAAATGQEAACSGHAHAGPAHAAHAAHGEGTAEAAALCGAEEGACCGGHSHAGAQEDPFAFPTTTEQVTMSAVQLAGLLDLIEKLAEDPAVLHDEVDYEAGQHILADQAPELVRLRDEFLERMKVLLAGEVGVALGS